MNIIEKGIEQGLIRFDEEKKNIFYIHQDDKRRNFNNPEEKVQAEAYLKLVLNYGYSPQRILQFKSITMGASVKEVDIVVYNDDECTQPHIVVECKREEVSELEFEQAIKQGASYAYALSGTVKYLWVTSKVKNESFLIDKESDLTQTIPNIPRYGITEIQKYQFAKGGRIGQEQATTEIKEKFFELEIISEEDLTKAFKSAHNSLWAGGELNPSEAFDELDKLIFCKIWDERMLRKEGEPYDFQVFSEPIPKNASKEQKARIEEKITNELYKRVVALYAIGKKKDPEVFKDDVRLSPQKVKAVVGYLERINLGATDLDSKGKAFETFMGSYFRGDFGQFFTPRPIVKFIVNSLPITHESKVLDTSCGSGGFLLYALDKVRQEADEYYPEYQAKTQEATKHWSHWHDFAEKRLFGIEINEQIARTAKMNMIIHDDGHTNVISSDGLLRDDVMQERSNNKDFKYGTFDFIITNPPFGSTVKQTEKAYLNLYNLGNKDISWLDTKNSGVKERANQSTEVLFIEQCHNFLNENGYLAVVIPDGILTNSSLQYVRDRIEEWYQIIAVVSMPQTAFSHTGAGVKSSVLFLRKWPEAVTVRYQTLKKELQDQIKEENNFLTEVAKIENEKKRIVKNHTDFENITGETDKKRIEKTEIFTSWKKEINDNHNLQITDLKEDLADKFILKKQEVLDDYPIFMAIAEDIGYDATGRSTGNNELEMIETELTRFINGLDK
ncbi:N-6 DNA methylase [Labilibaculum sp. DW002]|uniref:N-6 DNA methylase n=1 Tax=Paralabilibaculum antarcticum TaxID=2912572 RepID=A0ABT5VV02_9BACT|nr:N-6 DNA methylase [Labilibaculum sp. DW002]MDE5419147.1 N-6 DNA methylase [Labilibaculum sp. DW002]